MIIGNIVKKGLENISGEFLGRIKDKQLERSARKKQDRNVQNVIDRIISAEKNSQYYDALLKIIDNSTAIKDLVLSVDNGSIGAFDFDARVEQAMDKVALSVIEKNYVRGIMSKIHGSILLVKQKAESAAEQRIRTEVQIEGDRTRECIDDNYTEIKKMIEAGYADINDMDYDVFESNIVDLYIQGNMSLIQKALLILPQWERNGQARLPIKVKGLFEFMRMIVGCYENGHIDYSMVDDCLKCNISSRIKELILSVVFVYGQKGDSDKLLDKYGKTHLSEYAQLLVNLKREYISMDEIIQQSQFVQLWAVLSMFNISRIDVAHQYIDFFKKAEKMLPKPVIEARHIIINEAHYAIEYALCTNTEKVYYELDRMIYDYIQLRSFFDTCGGEVKEKYYIDLARLLTDATDDLLNEWSEVVFENVKQEACIISLKGHMWRSNPALINETDFEDYFTVVQNVRDKAIPINLLYAAYLSLGAGFVKAFFGKRMILLEKDIHYLRLALQVGMDRKILDDYDKLYGNCPEFYILKAIYLSGCVSDAEEEGVFSGDTDSLMRAMEFMSVAVKKVSVK